MRSFAENILRLEAHGVCEDDLPVRTETPRTQAFMYEEHLQRYCFHATITQSEQFSALLRLVLGPSYHQDQV